MVPQKTGKKTEVEKQDDLKTGPSKHILVDNLQNSFNWLPLSLRMAWYDQQSPRTESHMNLTKTQKIVPEYTNTK